MTPPAHLASGIIIFYLLKNKLKTKNLLIFALLGSMAPDIDGLFGKSINIHRYGPFHAPLCWLGLFILALFIIKKGNTKKLSLVFFTAVFVHLFLDWFSGRTAGIQIFYPFSKKISSLFPIQPEKGNLPVLPNKKHLQFWKFYTENKFLFLSEVILILSGIILFVKLLFAKRIEAGKTGSKNN